MESKEPFIVDDGSQWQLLGWDEKMKCDEVAMREGKAEGHPVLYWPISALS